MQRPQDLARVAEEHVEDLAADGVIYAEVRFAPQLHTRRGMSLQQIVDTVAAALRRAGEKHGVETGLILCCLRHESPAQSRAVAELAVANRHQVCALDLAGDEAAFPARGPTGTRSRIAREPGCTARSTPGRTAGRDASGGPGPLARGTDRPRRACAWRTPAWWTASRRTRSPSKCARVRTSRPGPWPRWPPIPSTGCCDGGRASR